MKTYDEMAKYVLEVRDEHERKRKRRIYIAKRAVPAAAGVLGAFIIGFGIMRNYKRPDTFPTPDTVVEIENTTVVSTALPQDTETAATTAVVTSTDTAKTTVSTSTVTSVSSQSAANTQNTTEKTGTTAAQTTSAEASMTTETTAVSTTITTTVTQKVTTTTERVSANPPGGISDPPNGGTTTAESHDPWYDMPIHKQYYNALLDGYVADLTPAYRGGYPISDEWVGERISGAKMKSQKLVDGVVKQCMAEAFRINCISDEKAVAIRFEGHEEFYLYHIDGTDLNGLMKEIPPLET